MKSEMDLLLFSFQPFLLDCFIVAVPAFITAASDCVCVCRKIYNEVNNHYEVFMDSVKVYILCSIKIPTEESTLLQLLVEIFSQFGSNHRNYSKKMD